MIEIIPAIDLLGGKCVRLHQGNYNLVTEFSSDPIQQALIWQEKGATRLHLVDLDGAKTGKPVNDLTIKAIKKELTIPIQIGGGIRSQQRAEDLINTGIDRVILGTIAIEKPEIVNKLSSKYPGKIIVGIDAKDGRVATRGWINQSKIKATDLVKNLSKSSISAIISTDISTDGTLEGPNLDFLKDIASVSNVPVIASGGIGTIGDILSLLPLEHYGICGVIIGRALYDGKIDLTEAIRVTKNQNMNDITYQNMGTC